MTTVTVYTTGAQCMQCRLTSACLTEDGVAFTEVDLTDPERATELAYVTEELGYSRAPIVLVDGEPEHHWSGFRPDLIHRLAKRAILPSDATREARSPAR